MLYILLDRDWCVYTYLLIVTSNFPVSSLQCILSCLEIGRRVSSVLFAQKSQHCFLRPVVTSETTLPNFTPPLFFRLVCKM